ncbi:MAG: hypothetical protein U9P63_02715, partial [Patescibacteria group bacterium]|nr:hypothetical protein [Patescibacteria group bacterium]
MTNKFEEPKTNDKLLSQEEAAKQREGELLDGEERKISERKAGGSREILKRLDELKVEEKEAKNALYEAWKKKEISWNEVMKSSEAISSASGKETEAPENNKDMVFEAWKRGDLSFSEAVKGGEKAPFAVKASESDKDTIFEAWKKGDLSFSEAVKGEKDFSDDSKEPKTEIAEEKIEVISPVGAEGRKISEEEIGKSKETLEKMESAEKIKEKQKRGELLSQAELAELRELEMGREEEKKEPISGEETKTEETIEKEKTKEEILKEAREEFAKADLNAEKWFKLQKKPKNSETLADFEKSGGNAWEEYKKGREGYFGALKAWREEMIENGTKKIEAMNLS